MARSHPPHGGPTVLRLGSLSTVLSPAIPRTHWLTVRTLALPAHSSTLDVQLWRARGESLLSGVPRSAVGECNRPASGTPAGAGLSARPMIGGGVILAAQKDAACSTETLPALPPGSHVLVSLAYQHGARAPPDFSV